MQNYPITRSQGNFSWPNGARIAVVLTSEYEPVYEIKPLAGGQPNYRQHAEMRYEATRGIWRVLDVLTRRDAHPVVGAVFDAADITEAYAALGDRQVLGRAVVTIGNGL